MNRKKLNAYSKSSDDSHWKYNDLYRRFHKEFDWILNAQTLKPDVIIDCYVKNPDIEDRLDLTINSDQDTIQFMIGRTGIGKSTILRHKFKTFRKPIINNETLIIPFSFDSMTIRPDNCQKKISAVVNTATRKLNDKYNINFDDDNFVKFIEEHSEDVFFRNNTEIDLTSHEFIEVLKKDQYAYSLERLKYYIHLSGLKKLIILVDDIESEEHSVQELIINDMCHFYGCMQNYENKQVAINLIFSVRPITAKLIRKNKLFNSFPFFRDIIIKKPVTLNELFVTRMNYAINKVGADNNIIDKDSWNEALKILLNIVESVSNKYSDGILNLFNNNVRGALSAFQVLITNRLWLQKDHDLNASFKIDENDYSLNRAAIYRALGMRNGNIYPVTGTCITNIFWNTAETKYDLLIVYIIKYFIEINKNTDFLDQDATYYDILEAFKKVFCINGFPETIDRIIKRMEEVKLIEIETNGDANLTENKHIVLLPRAEEIWNLLVKSSVLFEMFRDDTYHCFPERNAKLSTFLSSDSLFLAQSEFLLQIVEWEEKYINNFLNNDIEFARNSFGESTISSHILEGIKESMRVYYKEQEAPSFLLKEIEKLKDKVSKLNKKYASS